MIRNINNNDFLFMIDSFKSFNILKKEEDFFKDDLNKYLIYEYNNKPVGFLEYSLYYDRLELNYIYIDSKFRKKGFGSELLEYFINLYKDQNILNITLEVAESNVAAIELYKKKGFEVVAVRERYYSNYENAYLMERKF